jgi:hypothetical protein
MPAVVLDANLLVLLVAGMSGREYIGRHRRLRAYTESDFDLLLELIAPMSSIIVTPNILTETSNLLRLIPEPARARISETFRKFIDASEEHYIESSEAAKQREFIRLGLTDSGILTKLTDTDVLLTADLDLYVSALRRGWNAVNFNHLRQQ